MSRVVDTTVFPDSLKIICWGALAFVGFDVTYLAVISHFGYRTGATLLVPALLLQVFAIFFIYKRSRFGKALFHVSFAIWTCLSLVAVALVQLVFAPSVSGVNPFLVESVGLLLGQLAVLLVFNIMLCSKQLQHYWS